MDAANELSEFLTSWRAKVALEQAGLRRYGRRQVPGLRREEVAVLTAEPGTRSAEALDLLASWTATPEVAAAPGEGPPL